LDLNANPSSDQELRLLKNVVRVHDPAPDYLAYIGIDWGDCHQWYALGEPQHAQLQRGCFTLEELPEWLLKVRQRFGHGRVAIGIEASRTALIYALAQAADFIDVYCIPTTASDSYRQQHRPSGAKTDPTDAQALLEALCTDPSLFRRWQHEDPSTRMLDLLCQHRRRAVDERTALTNQLTAQLKLSYRVALEMCREKSDPMLLHLLQRWPSLEKLKSARPATLKKFFYLQGIRRKDSLHKRLDLIAGATAILTDEAILLPAQMEIVRLVRCLLALLPAIAAYDAQILKLFNSHPDAFIYKSLPGAGPALEPRLLCALGTVRQRWGNPQAIQCFSGLSPVIKSSGKSCTVHKRCACPKYLRQTFHEYAASSIKFCSWAKAFYNRQIERGKKHHTAVRALAWRWLRILWRIWKDRVPYQEAIFLKAQQQHQRISPQLCTNSV
jgi:transposase